MRKFMQTRLQRCAAAALLSANLGVSAQGLDFNGALRAALERAPALQARSASVQGAAALQTSAAELPDPKLSVGIDSLPINGPDRGSLTRDNFTQRQLGWTQDVPNRAKRAARADAALARTEREQALLQMERLAVRREAGLAWLARYFADRRLLLFDELIAQQRRLQETAPAQLAAGKINPVDVSMIKLETLALADRRDELQRESHHAHALLRRWIGDADADGKNPNASNREGSLAGGLPVFKVDRPYLQTNLERTPEIAALIPSRAMADAEVREAEAAQSGDWSWSIRYGKRGPAYSDFVSAQLSFDLPMSTAKRQQPQIYAKQKEVERITAERDDMLRRQTQELESQLSELSELDSKLVRLTGQTLPLAAERSALALVAYQSGRDKLAAVLDARKQQTELGLRALELQAKQRAVQWRLNSILPEPVP